MTCATSPVLISLRGFCGTMEAEKAPSLELLRAVEGTVDVLTDFEKKLRAHHDLAIGLAGTVAKCDREQVLDPKGKVVKALDETEQRLHLLVNHFQGCLESAKHDPQLKAHNEELVVSSYERAIAALVALHNAVIELRWAVLEHDADLEEAGADTFESVDDFIESLKG